MTWLLHSMLTTSGGLCATLWGKYTGVLIRSENWWFQESLEDTWNWINRSKHVTGWKNKSPLCVRLGFWPATDSSMGTSTHFWLKHALEWDWVHGRFVGAFNVGYQQKQGAHGTLRLQPCTGWALVFESTIIKTCQQGDMVAALHVDHIRGSLCNIMGQIYRCLDKEWKLMVPRITGGHLKLNK